MNESLMYLKKLEAVGIPRAQAEVTVEIMTDIIDKNLASKQDLLDQRAETSTEFGKVRAEMKSEFAAVRAEMKSEFTAVRAEMKTEFAAVRSEIAVGFSQAQSNLERMQDKVTIRLGMMLIAAVGALAAIIKF